MNTKCKLLKAGGSIMVTVAVTGLAVTSAFGKVASLDKVQDAFGTFPVPSVMQSTSATAGTAITFYVPAVDELQKHHPKNVYAQKRAAWSVVER